MSRESDTIYQSFMDSDNEQQIPIQLQSNSHRQVQQQQCHNCYQMQEYIHRLEQEVQELNRKTTRNNKPHVALTYHKLSQVNIKPTTNVTQLNRHIQNKSDSEISFKKLSVSAQHQKKRIFDDTDAKTNVDALQFYKM